MFNDRLWEVVWELYSANEEGPVDLENVINHVIAWVCTVLTWNG